MTLPSAPLPQAAVQQNLRFAFYGRVSTEDNQDPAASRAWQLRRARGLVEPKGGAIVAEYFDVDKSRSIPWARRPRASALIEALKSPARDFDAVVVGEPHRAFYGNQYSLTFPLFEHFQVPLWVPEVGGAIDPANEAHDMIMGVFGGLSKGERNRVKIRVRSAMAAITATEGRYLGGRPPYGYELIDAGPHPNPAKAADGKRLRRLVPHPAYSLVVKWIFAQFIGGRGIFDIAEELTREGVPSPSAADPTRNQHRVQVAWSKAAVRVIITNPRYTGRQVWNKQRKDEVLLDVNDVALGHTTKLRWNDRDQWVWSEQQAHEPLVSIGDFERAQAILASRGRGPATHKPHRTRRPYAFRGCLLCGYCERKMQGNWNNDQAYYRCRFPAEYALANKIVHPKVVYLREAEILEDIDNWLVTAFSPTRIEATIEALTEQAGGTENTAAVQLRKQLATCDQRLNQYRAALNAGADAVQVAKWINETEQERTRLEGELRAIPPDQAVSSDGLAELLHETSELAHAVIKAHPDDKADLYTKIGLKMTYYPQKQVVEARVIPTSTCANGLCPRGDTHRQHMARPITARFALPHSGGRIVHTPAVALIRTTQEQPLHADPRVSSPAGRISGGGG